MDVIDVFDENYSFLSNFHPSPMVINGIYYPTVEHYFQSEKTIDEMEKFNIIHASSPNTAKGFGRHCTLCPNWENIKDSVMLRGVQEKFRQNKNLKEKLLATGNAILIEGNTWHDNYWGNCTCFRCRDIKGKNQLGKTLMFIRSELKGEDE